MVDHLHDPTTDRFGGESKCSKNDEAKVGY